MSENDENHLGLGAGLTMAHLSPDFSGLPPFLFPAQNQLLLMKNAIQTYLLLMYVLCMILNNEIDIGHVRKQAYLL